MSRKLLWAYPTPDHPRRQAVWRVLHWRRHRRFMRYLDSRITEEFAEAFKEMT